MRDGLAIDAANTDWLPAMRAHDAVKIVQPCARGALYIHADGSTAHGLAAIRKMYLAVWQHGPSGQWQIIRNLVF